MAWLQHPETRRFARFLLVGALNTLFGYLAFCLLVLFMHYTLAGLLAMVPSVIWNFHTTGKLVFDGAGRGMGLRFAGVYAVLYGIGIAEQRVGELQGYLPQLTAAVCILPNAVLGYLLNKRLVFQPRR